MTPPTDLNLPADGETDWGPKLREALVELSRRSHSLENIETEAEIAPALARIVAAGGGALRVPHGVTLELTASIDLPNEVKEVIVDGRVIMRANAPILTRSGTVTGGIVPVTANVLAGAREITASSAGLDRGDWLFIASLDTLPGTTDKLAYLRQVRSTTAGTVTLDSPIPRSLLDSSNRRYRKVSLAAAITISGTGSMEYDTPALYTRPMIILNWVNGVRVLGVTLKDGGDTAVMLNHCVDYIIESTIDNFLDDLANSHVGYGVNVSGATRDGVVRGKISRCRHAVTTNVGPSGATIPEFPFYGEPENFVFEPVTAFCSDKALDTHRAGWGGRIIANDSGSGGAVQVRCDNVYVEIRTTGNFFGDVLTVGPNLVGVTVVGPVIASHCTAAVVRAFSEVYLTTFPKVYGGTPTLFAVAEGVSLTVAPAVQVSLQTAELSIADASLVDVPGMSALLEPNARYLLEGYVVYRASTAGDLKLALATPAGTTVNWSTDGLDASAGGATVGGSAHRSLAQTDETIVGGAGGGITLVANLTGRVVTGATAGPLALRAAQGTLDAGTPTLVRVGGYLRLERVR